MAEAICVAAEIGAISDNLISVRNISATEAARHFSDVLDAVESGRETFVVVRKGRAVAHIGPAVAAHGKAVKAIMRANPPDRAWLDDLRTLRAGLAVEDRPWSA